MPVIPNLLERLMRFRLNRGSGASPDLFGAAGFESATLANRLGLFEALAANGPLRAAELADQPETDPEGVRRLCEFLVAARYLATSSGRHRLIAMTERWLLASSDTDMGPFFTFWDELVLPFWERELETDRVIVTYDDNFVRDWPRTTSVLYCISATPRYPLSRSPTSAILSQQYSQDELPGLEYVGEEWL